MDFNETHMDQFGIGITFVAGTMTYTSLVVVISKFAQFVGTTVYFAIPNSKYQGTTHSCIA